MPRARSLVALSAVLLLLVALLAALPALGQETPDEYADPAFERTRDALDLPVAQGVVSRTWFYGPAPISEGVYETYDDSPDGERLVQYFDKARMEINQPDASPEEPWYVSTGLLVRELITGSVQVGDFTYEQHEPARIPAAGDADNEWPTYAGFASVIDRVYVDQTGQHATNILLPNGASTYPEAADDPNAELVHYIAYEGPNGPAAYNIPRAFWDFMNSTGVRWNGEEMVDAAPLFDWLYLMGYPIADPFWVNVQLAGEPAWVMVQPFERRLLTYTPANEEGWQVEMGNVGAHYLTWRNLGPAPEPTPSPSPEPTSEPTATATPSPTASPTASPTPTATTEPPLPPRISDEFFAMTPGSQWVYNELATADPVEVSVLGRTEDFINGYSLMIREERYADGTTRRTYWDPQETVLWLAGYEEFDDEGVLEHRVIFDPAVRYAGMTFGEGFGWGTTTLVLETGANPTLYLYRFEVIEEEGLDLPGGTFDGYRVVVTRQRTDGDNLIGQPAFVEKYVFVPNIGVVWQERADGTILELTGYHLQ